MLGDLVGGCCSEIFDQNSKPLYIPTSTFTPPPAAMDSTVIQLLLITLSALCAIFLLIHNQYFGKPKDKKALPRARGALPIIGHLHLFGGNQLLHRTLAAMAERYGPLFTVSLGSRRNLVVSSWEGAKECFTTLDKVFSDRPTVTASRILCYNCAMFGFAPYGDYWRQMRKIATLELLSHRRMDMLGEVRVSEVQTALKELYDLWAAERDVKKGLLVEMRQWFGDLTLSTIVRLVGGERLMGSAEGGQTKKLMKDFVFLFGVPVLSDAIPSLGWLDLQGHEKRMRIVAKELDSVIGKWLEEHKEKRRMAGEERVDQDFMDVMLTTMETTDFTKEFDPDTIVKSTCLNMVFAGSDTTMVTLIWALSLLLNNPHVLEKAQKEVDSCVGGDRHVAESDIEHLKYLEAVVKETLRLYPPVPVISLRSSMEDCTILPGYHVPSGTHLMVNIWKIQRDENLWPEPLEFKPERFLTGKKDIDLRGRNFELLPFGSGRRSCPGTSMALQMVLLTLASLLHTYEFSRPNEGNVDMTESSGVTNMKATPLHVYITPRSSKF